MDLLCLIGPTGVGKTKLSIELAKRFNGEIISGDAMQFYKGLDIGTAKASLEEQGQVKHHLLSFLEANDTFSVVDYQVLVRRKIQEIKDKGKLPILVGGSGLYVQSIVFDYKFSGKKHDKDNILESLSLKELQIELKNKNPRLYELTDRQNKRRLIRALEKDDSDIQEVLKPYYKKTMIIGLNTDRTILYEQINSRVHTMMDQGLLKEVEKLYKNKIQGQSIKAIGYKELYAYFDGHISLEEAVRLIQRNSRRYAKRQLTWFKNKLDVVWFESHLNDFNKTIEEVALALKKNL